MKEHMNTFITVDGTLLVLQNVAAVSPIKGIGHRTLGQAVAFEVYLTSDRVLTIGGAGYTNKQVQDNYNALICAFSKSDEKPKGGIPDESNGLP